MDTCTVKFTLKCRVAIIFLISLAAIAVGLELDIPFDSIREKLESFQGVHRRFEVLGEVNNIIVVDDYAHTQRS